MYVTVYDRTPTAQRRWRFWVNYPHMILQSYTESSKTTRQRNYRVRDHYDRADQRTSSIKLEDVPRPAWVDVTARDQVTKSLIVATDNKGTVFADYSRFDRPQGQVIAE